ncbi:MAG: 50S ribosomal protein L15 [Candidatus Nanohaloarchaeota archaeon QJJ-7]|nr:50S ribosomal protein L15 [Candidatus Nanohaloarchaeota archaeon QJJ-7]
MGNKDRGSGTHGKGSGKKGRGAGNRGGRGKAGYGKKAKHKKMKAWQEDYSLGEKGFKRPQSEVDDSEAINLRQVDQLIEEFVEEGFAEKEDGKFVFDAEEAGYDKILGGGRLSRDIDIKAPEFSSSAREKIEDSGNTAIEE